MHEVYCECCVEHCTGYSDDEGVTRSGLCQECAAAAEAAPDDEQPSYESLREQLENAQSVEEVKPVIASLLDILKT